MTIVFGMGGGGNALEVVIDGDSSGLQDAFSNAISEAKGFKGAMAGMGLAAAGLAGGAMAKAVGAAADFEEQMTNVQRVTDPETAREMEGAIQDMAGEMPVAHQELAKIAETAGRLGVSSENLEGFTETTAKMAASTDLAAEEAADAFARIGTLMDIPMENAENLGSAMDRLANNFGTSASEISDSMTRSAGALNTLGIGKDMALGLNAAMNEVSTSSEKAGTGLRTVAESLMKPSKVQDVADALGMTEEEFINMRDNSPEETLKMLSQKMNEGGQTSEQLRDALGKQATTLEKLGGNWDAVENATQGAGEEFENATALEKDFEQATNTLNAKLDIAKNQVRNVGISLGQALLPAINSVIGKIMPLVEGFGKWIQEGNNAKKVAVGLGAVMAGGLVPALSIVGPLFVSVAASMALPVAAMAALVAGAIKLYEAWNDNFAGIRDATMEVVDVFRTEFLGTFKLAKALVTTVLADLKNAFGTSMGESAGSVRELVNVVKTRLIAGIRDGFAEIRSLLFQAIMWWQMHKDDVIATVQTLVTQAREGFARLVAAVRTVVEPFLTRLVEFWRNNSDQIIRIVRKFAQVVQAVLGGLVSWLSTAFGQALTLITMAWERWGDETLAVINFVADATIGVAEWYLDYLETLFDVVLAAINGNWTRVWTLIKNFLQDTLNGLADFARKWGPQLIDVIVGTLTAILDATVTWGTQFVDTIVQWLLTAAQQFDDFARALAEDLFPALWNKLIELVRTFGPKFIQLIKDFLTTTAEKFVEFAQLLVNDLFPTLWNKALELARTFGPKFTQWAVNMLNLVAQKFVEFGNYLVNTVFPNLWNTALSLAQQFGPKFLQWAINLLNTVAQKFVEFGNYLVNTVFPNLWNRAIALAQQFGPKFLQWAINLLNTVAQKFVEFGNYLVNTVFPNLWNTALSLAQQFGPKFIQWAINMLNTVAQKFVEFGNYLVNTVFPNLWNTVLTLAQQFGPKFLQWAIDMLNLVLEKFIEFGKFLVNDLFPELWDKLLTLAEEWGNQFLQWAIDGLNLVLDVFIEFGDFLVNDLFPELWDKLLTAADNFGTDFENWAIDTLNAVLDLFGEFKTLLVGEDGIIPNLISDALDKFETWKDDLVGEDGHVTNLKDDAIDLMDTLKTDLVGEDGKITNLVSDFVDLIIDLYNDVTGEDGWLASMSSKAVTMMGDMGRKMGNALKSAWNSVIPSSLDIPEVGIDTSDLPGWVPDRAKFTSFTIGGGSFDLPQFDVESAATGGRIRQGGLLQVHSGEEIISAAEVDRGPVSSSSGREVYVENLYTHARTRAEARQVKSELAQALEAENIRH